MSYHFSPIRTALDFIHARASTVSTWLGRANSEENGTPSSKRLLFFLAVGCSLGLCTFDAIKHGGIQPQVIDVLKFVIGVTGAANVASRISDNMSKPGDGPPPGAPATP
jgi:hypothetical protein